MMQAALWKALSRSVQIPPLVLLITQPDCFDVLQREGSIKPQLLLRVLKTVLGRKQEEDRQEETWRVEMLGSNEQRSEVARLLAQISAEYEAAQQGLTGLSYGSSQHEFITARMENMGHLHTQLQDLVGDAAIAMIAEQLNRCPDPVSQSAQSSS